MKSGKFVSKRGSQIEIVYKCNKCSYIIKINSEDSPPSFCPNCALNGPKGEMICIEGPYSVNMEKGRNNE